MVGPRIGREHGGDRDDAHDAAHALGPGHVGHHELADRQDHAAADALDDAEDDELGRRPGQPAQHRPRSEEHERQQVDLLGAEAPRGPAGDRDHRRQRQHVAGHDPLDLRDRAVQLAPQRRQRDVDDRGVEDRHDRADEDDGADPPDVRVDAIRVGGHELGSGPRRARPNTKVPKGQVPKQPPRPVTATARRPTREVEACPGADRAAGASPTSRRCGKERLRGLPSANKRPAEQCVRLVRAGGRFLLSSNWEAPVGGTGAAAVRRQAEAAGVGPLGTENRHRAHAATSAASGSGRQAVGVISYGSWRRAHDPCGQVGVVYRGDRSGARDVDLDGARFPRGGRADTASAARSVRRALAGAQRGCLRSRSRRGYGRRRRSRPRRAGSRCAGCRARTTCGPRGAWRLRRPSVRGPGRPAGSWPALKSRASSVWSRDPRAVDRVRGEIDTVDGAVLDRLCANAVSGKRAPSRSTSRAAERSPR